MIPYVGRFAPSPTGALHAGSLVAALASYLDARAHHGMWLVRIEDVDETRAVSGAAENILQSLSTLGMKWDGDVIWQSRRKSNYEAALEQLGTITYPCACSRREISDSRIAVAADGAAVYPGLCRNGLTPGKKARALRVQVPPAEDKGKIIEFEDRWVGHVSQNLALEVGDFVLKRADGFFAYQLAVVADDALQKVSHIVRGADLLESTPRQIYLQRLLGIPMPTYMHVPIVTDHDGEKLSKQTGAKALDLHHPLRELIAASQFLGLELDIAATLDDFWKKAISIWSKKWLI